MVFNLLSFEYWFYFLYTILSVFVAIYVPGIVSLRFTGVKFNLLGNIVLSIIVGSAFWSLQGFIFGFLDARFLTYIYLVLFFIFWVRSTSFKMVRIPRIKISVKKTLIISVIIIGVMVQNSSVFFTGIEKSSGIYFCCSNPSDSLYFLSLSNEIKSEIPPSEPGLADVSVKNYHYLSNIFVAELSRVFLIPINIIQFQFLYIYISIFLGLTVLLFGYSVTKNIWFSFWLLFFIYFGGDFIWLLMLILQKGAHYFTMSSIEDGAKFLANTPRAFAVVIFFGGMSLLKMWLVDKSNVRLTIVTAIVFGVLVGFKVYVGIFAVLGLFAIFLYGLLRRDRNSALLFVLCVGVSIILYLPINSDAGGLYFTSFWFFENFIIQPYFQLERLEFARVIFLNDEKYIKAFSFDLLYVVLAIFSIFGTKLLGIIQTPSSLKIIPLEIHIFLLSGLAFSFVVGFFFQQNSGEANTFNFIVNVFILFSIYTALTMTRLMNFRRSILVVSLLMVILFTIPRVINVTYSNIKEVQASRGFVITEEEIQAYKFLENQSRGRVAVNHSYFEMDKSSPYIRFFTNQPMFFSGVGILESHNVDIENKLLEYELLFEGPSATEAARIVRDNRIQYIITGVKDPVNNLPNIITGVKDPVNNLPSFTDVIYSNKEVEILKVSRSKIDKLIIN